MKSSFIGSTVAMVIGAISLLGQLSHWPSVNDDNIFGGVTAILGAMAYRSAKQRRLGLNRDATWRRIAEVALLALVCLPVPFAIVTVDGVVHNPWSSIVVPAWSIIAYLIVRYRRVRGQVHSLTKFVE